MKSSTYSFLLVVVLGCSQSPEASNTNGRNLTQTLEQESATDWFVLVSRGLGEDLENSVKSEIVKLVNETAEPADTVHVISCPKHQPIASFVIPDCRVKRQRTLDAGIRNGFQKIKAYFDDTADVPYDLQGQLQIPQLPSTVWSLRRNLGSVKIVLIGTPVYVDKTNHPLWSFTNQSYPTDASLTHESSTCPFRNLGHRPIPSDAEISWVTLQPRWGDNKRHRERILRFCRLAFQSQLGGTLKRLTSDAETAFSFDVDESGFPAGDIEPTTDYPMPGMIKVREETVIERDEQPTATLDVHQAINAALQDPSQILLAINWTSADPNCDIDMWIRSRGGTELNFTNKLASYGRLYRDVTSSGRASDDVSEFRNWEFAVINHDRINDLTLWLNAYATSAPANMRLVAVWKGEQQVRRHTLNVTNGDHASGKSSRAASEAWLKVGLSSVFTDS